MSFDNGGTLYCYNHPKRETHLRCNKCERPICASCAVLTPTGYRCKECVRGQQKVFDTAKWWDYPVTFISAGILSAIGSYFVSKIGFFTIFLAPVAGIGIAEAVRFLVRRRRSRSLPTVAMIGTLLGGLGPFAVSLITVIPYLSQGALSGQGVLSLLIGLLWPAAYAIIACSTVFYRLKGIKL
jgi:hypothetical protein